MFYRNLMATLALVLALLAACSPQVAAPNPAMQPTPHPTSPIAFPTTDTPPTAEPLTNEALVDTVQFQITETMPLKGAVEISGNLPDGCVEITNTAISRDGSTFTIQLITQRDPLAICAQALVPFTQRVDLDVAGLEAGTYTVEVIGRDQTISHSFELAAGNGSQNTSATLELPTTCFPTNQNNSPFINVQDGYCLHYPALAGFSVKDVMAGGIAAVWGPPLTPSLEPVRAGLGIYKQGTADGRTLDEIVADILSNNPEATVVEATATFAGEAAQIIEGMDGMMDSRRTYLIHNGYIYEIALVPLTATGDLAAEVLAQRDLLWQTVSDSFTWLPASAVEQFSACPTPESAPFPLSPYVNLPAAYCLQYPSHYAQQEYFPENRLFLYGPALDPTIPEPVRVSVQIEANQAANGRTLEQVVADITSQYTNLEIEQTPTTLGGETAVVLTGLPSREAGRDLYAIHNDTVYHIRIDPLGFPELVGDLDATWETILNSFTFIN